MESLSETNKSLKDLRAAILLDAKQRAAKIMQDASATMMEIERELEQRSNFLQGERLNEIFGELSEEIADVKTALARDKASTILQFKQEMLDKAIKDMKKRFCQKMVDDPDRYYHVYLANVITDSLAMVSFKEYYIIMNTRDAKYVKEHDFLQQFGKKILVSEEHFQEDDIGCIVMDRSGSIKIDQRLSKKVEANEQYLKMKLSSILFSE